MKVSILTHREHLKVYSLVELVVIAKKFINRIFTWTYTSMNYF